MALPSPEVEKTPVEPEEISISTYRNYLLEMRWEYQKRATHYEGLLGRLDVAVEDKNLRVYCYELEEGFQMRVEEKGTVSFLTKKASGKTEPVGGVRISAVHYREKLEEVHQNCLNQVGQLENFLDVLGKALGNRDLRIKCYRTEDGVEMNTEEKDKIGFEPLEPPGPASTISLELFDLKG